MFTASILVSSFFYCNQQSCGLGLQNRMVADFLCSFCGLFSLSFRLKNLVFRQRNAHEMHTKNAHVLKCHFGLMCMSNLYSFLGTLFFIQGIHHPLDDFIIISSHSQELFSGLTISPYAFEDFHDNLLIGLFG